MAETKKKDPRYAGQDMSFIGLPLERPLLDRARARAKEEGLVSEANSNAGLVRTMVTQYAAGLFSLKKAAPVSPVQQKVEVLEYDEGEDNHVPVVNRMPTTEAIAPSLELEEEIPAALQVLDNMNEVLINIDHLIKGPTVQSLITELGVVNGAKLLILLYTVHEEGRQAALTE